MAMKCKIITVRCLSSFPDLGRMATTACDKWLEEHASGIAEVISIRVKALDDHDIVITIKYLPTMPISTTNSPIGSHHWFHTLLAPVLHIGEFLESHPAPTEDMLRAWGKTVFENCKELRDGFKSINNG